MRIVIRSSAVTTLVVLLLCNSFYFGTLAIISMLWLFYLSAGQFLYSLLFNVFTFIPGQRVTTNIGFLFWSVLLVSSDVLIAWRGMMQGYLFLVRLTEHVKSGILFWDELHRIGKAEVVVKSCLGFFVGLLQISYLMSLTEVQMDSLATHPLMQTVLRHSSESSRARIFGYPSFDSKFREGNVGEAWREHEGLRLLALVAVVSTVVEVFFVLITLVLLLGGFLLCERVWGAWRNPLSETLHHTLFDPRSERVFFIPSLVKKLVSSLFCFWFLLCRSNAFLLQCVLGISTYLFCDDWALLQTERDALSGIPLVVVTESETSCCICMDEIPVSKAARRLPCGHLFHSACLRKWIVQHQECPLCRRCTTVDSPFPFPGQAASRDSFHSNSSEGSETTSRTPSPVPTTVRARRMHRAPNTFRQQVVDAMSHRHPRHHPSFSATTVAPTRTTPFTPRGSGSRLQNVPLHSTSRRHDTHPSLSVDGMPPVYHPTSDLSVVADHREDPGWSTARRDEAEGVAGRESVELGSLLSAGLRLRNAFPLDASGVTEISFSLEESLEDSGTSTSSSTSSESSSREGSSSNLTGTLERSNPEPRHQSSSDSGDGDGHSERVQNGVAKRRMRVTNLPQKRLFRGSSVGDAHEEMSPPTRRGKNEKEVEEIPKRNGKKAVEMVEVTTFEDVSLLQSSSPSSLTPLSIGANDLNPRNKEVRRLPTKSQRKRPRPTPRSSPKTTPSSKEKDDDEPQRRRRPRQK